MSDDGHSLEVVSLGSHVYVKAGAAVWKHYIDSVAARYLEGKWIEAPATGQFKFASQLTNLKSFLKPLLQPHTDKIVKTGTRVIIGQKVIGVHDQLNGTLYVASVGRPYPIETEQAGAGGGRLTFSGFNQPVSITAPAESLGIRDALARAMVGGLSTVLRRYGHGWRRTGRANDTTRCMRLLPGRPARVISPYFEYRGRLGVGLGVYVYKDQSAARKALRAMGGERNEACRARLYVAEGEKQSRYSVGRPDIVPSKTVKAGHTTRMTTAIVVPVTYRGHGYRFYLDEAAVQNGRFIVWFVSSGAGSELSWDENTVRRFSQALSVG